MKEIKNKYINRLERIPQIADKERKALQKVADEYAFRVSDYYLSLIDWDDANDPIRRLVIPQNGELDGWGELDPSNEEAYTKAPGLQHKYRGTALLLVNDVCGAYCRFCFRKRLFMDANDEVTRDISEGLEYIREHREINNVLLTGGDPLVMSTKKLESIIGRVREIDHVKIIRIGSKMLAFNPFRVLDDPSLLEMLSKYSEGKRKIYLMAHFNHPRELTPEAVEAVNRVMKAGVIVMNQTPLIQGVNDNPYVLSELFNELSYMGVAPYYVFQCRPTSGNKMFSLPLEQAYEIFEKAKSMCSGLGKRARFAMSHATGKIEVVGKMEGHIFFKYHRAPNKAKRSTLLAYKSNPKARWFDDYNDKDRVISLEKERVPFVSVDSY
ncbi:Lysine 2,3-aminomutase related protein [hydrothermal vent metagenome]|uniref:Lysine 2,3-aminomutase related protein n=1 Tax=hydrothermal vent metagenome TaxID=652676 RepID=A0A3B1C0P4_9ZZZZ